MLAEINQDGLMTVSAQTQLEAYALKKWVESNTFGGESGPNLVVDVNVKNEEENHG